MTAFNSVQRKEVAGMREAETLGSEKVSPVDPRMENAFLVIDQLVIGEEANPFDFLSPPKVTPRSIDSQSPKLRN